MSIHVTYYGYYWVRVKYQHLDMTTHYRVTGLLQAVACAHPTKAGVNVMYAEKT
jgi:hypothetical protein